MTTAKQIEANRKNAALSTGPKTMGGKMNVSKNAIKHGLLTKAVYVDDAIREDFQEMRDRFYEEYCPESQLEHILLDRAVSSAWRLSLIVRVETEFFESWKKKPSYYDDEEKLSWAFTGNKGGGMALLSRYEAFLEKTFYRAITTLREIHEKRGGVPKTIETIVVPGNLENGFVS